MWAVVNESPLQADRNWIRDKHGHHHFVVAVKGTFALDGRGKLSLAEEQRPVTLAPVYNGEDGRSSLRYDSDLGPMKVGTDVLVHGRAHAPDRPVAELAVSLRVGARRKNLLVRGDNVFHDAFGTLGTTKPTPFTTMPIVYERAYGGSDCRDPDPKRQRVDLRNPVGVGVAVQAKDLAGRPAPNVVHPNGERNSGAPAGFGPIPSHWSPRLERAGTFDERWIATRKPLLPEDYDERFANCSPDDQRFEYLQPGEEIEVVHCSPDRVFAFAIPPIAVRLRSYFGLRKVECRALLVTVIAEPEARTVEFVWQASLPVPALDVDYLDATHVDIEGIP